MHSHRFWFSVRLLFGAACLWFSAGDCFAQRFPADPVEELRNILRRPFLTLEKNPELIEYRQKSLAKQIEALHLISDLRRALLLQEWRDQDREKEIAQVDQQLRTQVAEKFEKQIRAMMRTGKSMGRLSSATLLGEMGVVVRGAAGNRGGAARPLAPDLAELTKANKPEIRVAAAWALGRINPEPSVAVPALARLLRDDELLVRQAAASGLAELVQTVSLLAKGRSVRGVDATRQQLIDAAAAVSPAARSGCSDQDPIVRRLATMAIRFSAVALGELIVDPLPRQDFPPEDRQWLAKEISIVDEYRQSVEEERKEVLPLTSALSEASSTLSSVLNDANPDVRVEARRALEEAAYAQMRLLRRAASVPVIKPENRPVPEKKQDDAQGATRGGSPATSFVVLTAAEKIVENKNSLKELLRAKLPEVTAGIHDPDVQVRLQSLYVLEMMEEEARPAASALVEALDDPNHFVRWAAARALGKTGAVDVEHTVPALAKQFHHPDNDLRLAVASTLEHYGSFAIAALPEVTQAASKGDVEIRIAAMRTLVGMGPMAAPAIPALIVSLEDPNTRIRRQAAETLGKFGTAAMSAEIPLRNLLRRAEPDERRAISDALLDILQRPAK